MKTRFLLIIGIVFVGSVTSMGFSDSNAFFEGGIVVELPLQSMEIEKINDMWYYVSEPFTFESLIDKIVFQNIEFSPLYVNVPPRYTYSDVIFPDEMKETLSVLLFEYPDFTKHVEPQAGLVQRDDGFHLLVSMSLKEMSPSKQDKMGVRFQEIQCKDGLELVGKMPYAHPKCVKPESVEKLVMRGWATTNKTLDLINPTTYMIEKNGDSFEIQYSLNGATLENIAHDVDSNSVHVSLSESVGGQITISIPRDLMDAKMGNDNDDVFFVLVDGIENMYGEKTTDESRIITVWFPKDAHDIEIIGTFWI